MERGEATIERRTELAVQHIASPTIAGIAIGGTNDGAICHLRDSESAVELVVHGALAAYVMPSRAASPLPRECYVRHDVEIGGQIYVALVPAKAGWTEARIKGELLERLRSRP